MLAFLAALPGCWEDLPCSEVGMTGGRTDGEGHTEFSMDMTLKHSLDSGTEISNRQLETQR